MSYEVFLERKAIKSIKKLSDKDKERIKRDIRSLKDFPDRLDVKKLSGMHNKYRIRSGGYRIIIEIEDGKITVIDVLPRRTAYR